jgi:hypothetical protein
MAQAAVAEYVLRVIKASDGDCPMKFDLAAVNWTAVTILTAMAFVASIIGEIFAIGSRILGPPATAIAFAVIYVVWVYYPHGLLPGFTLPH